MLTKQKEKFTEHFQMSRTALRSIINKFNESRTVQNKPDRGRKPKISKNK